MYNGIGLQTARGSGTNGYVQTNRFLVKPRVSKVLTDSSLKGFGSGEGTAGLSRKPNREILEHDRKRQIELKLLVLEEKLTDQGYTETEIEERLDEARRGFQAKEESLEDGELGPADTRISDTQTHQIAARKERQMETLRAALGIGAESKSQNKLPAMLASDSEDMNDESEPCNGRKVKKNREADGDDTSDLRNIKKSHGNESGEDTFNKSTRQNKQRSGKSHRGDSSDNDDSVDKVVKTSQKILRRKTSSESDDKDANAKRKKKSSQKSISSRRRHDSDSSDSESDTDSSSDSDSDDGREHDRSLKKRDPREDNRSKYHRKEMKQATKKPRKTLSSSESDQSDDVRRKKILPRKSNRSRRHESDSSSSESEFDSRSDTKSNSDSGRAEKVDIDLDDCKGKRVEDRGRYEPRRYVEPEKIQGNTGRTGEPKDTRRHEYSKYDTDSGSDSDGHAKRALKEKNPKDNYRRFDGDLNDSRRVRKEHAHGDDNKSRHERDADGLDKLRKSEKDYEPKEEKIVNSGRVRTETKRSKRKTDDRTWDEQPARKSRRENMNDLDYHYSEYPTGDRWGADSAREYDMPRRESGEDRDRQGRKHGRDEEEQRQPERNRREQDDRRGSKYDKDADSAREYDMPRRESGEDRDRQGRKHGRDEGEQRQPERNRREQDDRRGSKYDKDRDHDLAKRARYDDSRSGGKKYDEDDDKHERKYSDGRHDDRRSRR